MEVELASCGNPDHFQDPDQPMWGCEGDCRITVNSLDDASAECRKFIERNSLGSGNWAGGSVYENNARIAQIAYNGRIIPQQEDQDGNKLDKEMTMNKKELVAIGIGDVPAWLAEDGLVLALMYFNDNELDPRLCFEANKSGNDIKLASHWNKAEKKANQVLAGDSRYGNSMIVLNYEVF
jgi:hypothetical protein